MSLQDCVLVAEWQVLLQDDLGGHDVSVFPLRWQEKGQRAVWLPLTCPWRPPWNQENLTAWALNEVYRYFTSVTAEVLMKKFHQEDMKQMIFLKLHFNWLIEVVTMTTTTVSGYIACFFTCKTPNSTEIRCVVIITIYSLLYGLYSIVIYYACYYGTRNKG